MVKSMPLSLRRRQRLAYVEPTQPEEHPAPDAPEAPTPPAEAPPAPEQRSRRRPRRRQIERDEWIGRVVGEAFFFLIGLTAWVINAIFTILGVMVILGSSPGALFVGLIIHLGISRAELHLWYRWQDPWYLTLLLTCVLIDVGTTLAGIVALLAERAPTLLGAAPSNVLQWHAIFSLFIAGQALPAWTSNASILLLLATGLALGSERLMRKFWFGLSETWREQHASS